MRESATFFLGKRRPRDKGNPGGNTIEMETNERKLSGIQGSKVQEGVTLLGVKKKSRELGPPQGTQVRRQVRKMELKLT